MILVNADHGRDLFDEEHAIEHGQRIFEVSFQNFISDDHQFSDIIERTFLDDLGQADIVVAKNAGNAGQCAGAVLHLHAEEIAAFDLVDMLDRQALVAGAADAAGAVIADIACLIDHIAHDSAGGGQFSCSSAVKHSIIYGITMNEDGIKGICN